MARKVLLENEPNPTEFVKEVDLPVGTLVKDRDGDVWYKDNPHTWFCISTLGFSVSRDAGLGRPSLAHRHGPYTLLSLGGDPRQWEDE